MVVVDVVVVVVVVDPVAVPVAEVVVGADVVVVQPSQMIASTLSSIEQVAPVPTTTSLERYLVLRRQILAPSLSTIAQYQHLVPVPESPQPIVHSLHSVQSVSSSSQGQSKLLHASSSISIPFVQELPLPLEKKT